MSRTTTILLLAATLAVVVFLAIYEPLTRAGREQARAVEAGYVLRLDPAKVRSIRISTGEKVLDIRRRGNGWQLGTKSKDRADTALVNHLLRTAAELTYLDRIPGRELTSDALTEFALQKPKRKIEFEGPEMAKVTLFFGRDAAGEKRFYVRTEGMPDVFVVPDEILQAAFRDTTDFRDRRLTDLNPGQIDRVIIRREGGEIELQHDPAGWQMTRPLHTRADTRKVQAFLDRVLGLRIMDYMGDDTGDLGIYGLTEGRDEITFFAEGGTRPQTLRLGADRDGGRFGQFTARDSVYRLPREVGAFLQVKPDDLRDPRLLVMNPDVVDRIRLRTHDKEFTIRRSAEGWEIQDGEAVRPASEAAVLAMWDALAKTEVMTFTPLAGHRLEDFGLEPPLLSVEFVSVLSENTPEARAGEQIVASLALGQTPNGMVYARCNESPEVAALPPEVLNGFPRDPGLWVLPR